MYPRLVWRKTLCDEKEKKITKQSNCRSEIRCLQSLAGRCVLVDFLLFSLMMKRCAKNRLVLSIGIQHTEAGEEHALFYRTQDILS